MLTKPCCWQKRRLLRKGLRISGKAFLGCFLEIRSKTTNYTASGLFAFGKPTIVYQLAKQLVMLQRLMRQLLLLTCFFLLSFLPAFPQSPDFKLNRTFGVPLALAIKAEIDKDGNLLILEHNSLRIFSANGDFLKTIDLVGDFDPGTFTSFELDQEGNIYLIDTYHSVIQKRGPAGELVFKAGAVGSGSLQFKQPLDLALDSLGNIYVADTDNNRIQKLDKEGRFIKTYKFPGDSVHNRPTAIEIAPNGHLIVLLSSGKLVKTDLGLGSLDIIENDISNTYPWSIYHTLIVDKKGDIHLFNSELKVLQKFSPTGLFLANFGTIHDRNDFSNPDTFNGAITEAAFHPNGNVYVTTKNGHSPSQIYLFASNGNFKKKIGNTAKYKSITQDTFGNYFLLPDGGESTSIQKFNSFGVFIKSFDYQGIDENFGWTPVTLKSDIYGNIYCLEFVNGSDMRARIIKFSNDGVRLTTAAEVGGEVISSYAYNSDFHIDHKGNLYVLNQWNRLVKKYNNKGEFIKNFGVYNSISQPKAVTVDKDENVYILDTENYRVRKFNADNELVNTFTTPKPDGHYFYGIKYPKPSMEVDLAGNLYLWNGTGNIIRVYNPAGTQIKQINGSSGFLSFNTTGNRLLVLNQSYVNEHLAGDPSLESAVTGRIFQDTNQNCVLDLGEKPIPGLVVKAEPGSYYGISDENGNYEIQVPIGTYTIKQIVPVRNGQTIIPLCSTSSTSVNILKSGIQVNGPNMANKVTNSPVLNLQLASTLRRRCFRNTTTVSFSNTGFATAPNAQVTVQFPKEVIFINASVPYTKDWKGNYVFEIGDLSPNQHGSIAITDSVSCADPAIRGLSVCTKAWISPKNSYPDPVAWDRSDIVVTAQEKKQEGSRFVLSNMGKGDMSDSLSFRILQDSELILTNQYKLAAGDSLVLKFIPTGRVLRLEAEMPENHPTKTLISATVEVVEKNTGIPSPAMNALPPDDEGPEVSQQCMPIVDSYDPNDKQVIPAGLTSENYTPTNTPLRYTVRFQNTGTDVAYRVVVVDTLSADLDISTLKVGAVSHPYRLSVSGKERPVLTFTFDNIMLPDSSKDLAGSNGLLQFSIRPKENLLEKHLIENLADIFFDYNEPMRTNTTVNRIYDMPMVLSDKPLLAKDVVASPSMTSFSPAAGKIGSEITVTGAKFMTESGKNQVYLNGAPAQILEASATTLKIRVPTNAFTGKIKVVTPDGAATTFEDFTVYQPPVITGLSSTEGVVGAEVTIIGEQLRPDLLESITLGTVTCQILRYANNGVIISIPEGATSGVFTVYSKGGTAKSTMYRVWQAPSLTGFDKARQRVGGNVTLQGENFATEIARNQVLFGDKVAKVLSAHEQQVTVQVPTGAVTGLVTITTPGGNSSKQFEIIPAPVITEVFPKAASVGTVVELKGQHFLTLGHQDTITFGQVKAEVVSASTTSLQVRVPRGATSGFVTVAGIGGSANTAFEVLPLTPQESIEVYPSPNQGKFTIDFIKADFEVQSLQILDKTGRIIHRQTVLGAQDTKMEIALPKIPVGMYVLLLQTEQGVVTKRVVIQ
jgi:uncharacterized repeat protein (TIGR01451 family)